LVFLANNAANEDKRRRVMEGQILEQCDPLDNRRIMGDHRSAAFNEDEHLVFDQISTAANCDTALANN